MIRPSVGWDVDGYRSDLGSARTEIFLQMGLDSQVTDLPVGQSADLSAVARTAKAEGVTCLVVVGERRITIRKSAKGVFEVISLPNPCLRSPMLHLSRELNPMAKAENIS
jgi:hypothetical protein